MDRDEERQAGLFESILSLATFTARRRHLAEVWARVEPPFFRLLAEAVEHGRLGEEDALTLCEDLIDAADGLDLRDDWTREQKIIVWAAAWFARRRTRFHVLLEDRRSPFNYQLLQEWLYDAFTLAQFGNHPKLGLAILNVLFVASPQAVEGGTLKPKADDLRYETVTAAAGIIISNLLGDYFTNAKRLFREADILYQQLAAEPMEEMARLTLELSAQNRLYLEADLIRDEGDPLAAIRLYQRALRQGEALSERALPHVQAELGGPRVGLCVPNTLWRMAKAEVMLWRLDDARAHVERALEEYRKLGDAEKDLAPQIELLARIEFLRADFEQAEALLARAARARAEAAV